MKIVRVLILLAAALLVVFVPGSMEPKASRVAPTPTLTPAAAQPAAWPGSQWPAATPEEQGIDSQALAGLLRKVDETGLNLHSLLIARRGTLVMEAYFQPYSAEVPQYVASVTKSVIATLVGIAVQQDIIESIDRPLVSFFPGREIANLDARKEALTLRHLLTLTAGLACDGAPLAGGAGMEQSADWVQFMLDAPMRERPGTTFNYCGGAAHLLSAVLQQASGMSAREFANRTLFAPLGIAPVPAERWQADPQGVSIGAYGLYLTPREMARLGYLYLRDGRWGERQVLPAGWVREATAGQVSKDDGLSYGYLWTVDLDQGSYSALGLAGQQIVVLPERDLVVVFTASLPSYQPNMDFLPLKQLLDEDILPAVKSDQPLPANPAAADRLAAAIRAAGAPAPRAAAIPDGALRWSGAVYGLDANPNGWETIRFDFLDGDDSIRIAINGQPVDPPVGLDGRYRLQAGAGVSARQGLRGEWRNESTLAVRQVTLGELWEDVDFEIRFAADEIELRGRSIVTGQEIALRGTRRADE